MASFRDRRNPEALRFTSALRFQVLILAGISIDLSCAVAASFSRGALWNHVFDAVLLLLLVAFKLRYWPREIVSDQFGLHSLGIFARKNIHIPWAEVGEIRPSTELPGLGPRVLGLRNDTIEFHSMDGLSAVVHTPHHSDRERLLHDVRLRTASSLSLRYSKREGSPDAAPSHRPLVAHPADAGSVQGNRNPR